MSSDCSICFNQIDNKLQYETECKHIFDIECILKWINTIQDSEKKLPAL
jgi:hypothetical protein